MWISGAASTLGSTFAALSLPLLALEITDSPTLTGGVAFVALASGLVGRIPAGIIVDSFPLRRVLISSELIYAVPTLLAGIQLARGQLTFPLLVIIAALGGTCLSTSQTAQSVILRDVVETDDLARAFALNGGRRHAVGLIGQPISGLLYSIMPALPMLADGASHVVAAALSRAVKPRMRLSNAEGFSRSESTQSDWLAGFRHIRLNRFLGAALLSAAAIQFLVTGLSFALVAAFRAEGVTSTMIGIMFAEAALGGIVGAIVTPHLQRRLSGHTQIAVLGWTLSISTTTCIWLREPFLAGLLLASIAFASTPATASIMASQMTCTPRQLHGRVVASGMILAGALGPIAPLAIGAPLEYAGRTTAFASLAIASFFTAILIQATGALREGDVN